MFVSAFDLYRIGLGPSSAHTTGPMRAARRFVHTLEADGVFFQARRVHIDLYGSIACNGRDQGTDRAILPGCAARPPTPSIRERLLRVPHTFRPKVSCC